MKPKYKREPKTKSELMERLKRNKVFWVKCCGNCTNTEDAYIAEVIPYKKCTRLNCRVEDDLCCPEHGEEPPVSSEKPTPPSVRVIKEGSHKVERPK